MPPKKQKETQLSLQDFANQLAGGSTSDSWADDEGDFQVSSFQSHPIPAMGGAAATGSWVSGGASAGGFSSGGFSSGGFTTSGSHAPIPDAPPYTARVGNVSYEVTEKSVSDFFSLEHNIPVEAVRLPRDDEGRPRGSAFVDFKTRDGLVAAIKLGGSQILGRTVSVNVMEQRGGGFGGGASFDWSRRAGAGPTDGAGLGSFSSGPSFGDASSITSGERFDRFRPKPRGDEPALNWGSRQGPTDGAGLRSFGGDRGDRGDRFGGDRFGGDRFGGEKHDWAARQGPSDGSGAPPRLGVNRGPRPEEPSFNWSAREPASTGMAAHRTPRPSNGPRPAEPSMDWSRRDAPAPARSGLNRRTGGDASGPRDWSARSNTSSPFGKAAPVDTTSSRPSGAISTATQQKKADPKLQKLQRGFNALNVDDDDEEETSAAKPKAKLDAGEAKSIGDIQQAQRETGGSGWNKAK